MNRLLISGVLASALALAVVTTAVPTPVAYAQTSIATLQAEINALLAQINQLQAQLSGTTPPTYIFTRNLGMGDVGENVRQLQIFLNRDPDTRVALSGAGSIGNETIYYGPATTAAVARFQFKYQMEVLAPLGLVNPTGYFGPSSRAKANALQITPTTPTTPTDGSTGSVLRGNGDLRTFEIDRVSDTEIEESAADAEVAELILEAENGDLELSRLDIALVADSGNSEDDPWDVFENVSLWIDGDKISERQIDDRSEYLSRSDGTVRFLDLDLILEEDEEVEMIVAVSVQNGVRGAGSNADWSISVEELRYFDADRVASDDRSTGDLGESVNFTLVERGEGEELKFALSALSPIAQTVIVSDDQRTSNVPLLLYTIEALDNDIDLDRLFINVQTGTADYEDVVSDIRLEINGQTFREDGVVSTGSYSANNVLVEFDIDQDITIDEDDRELVEIIVDLRAKVGYTNGESIKAQITSAERDMTRAEGADDIEEFSGTVIGKEQILISEGIFVPVSSVQTSTEIQGDTNPYGVFTIEFDVSAVEDDFYIAPYAALGVNPTTGGAQFAVETAALVTPTTVSAVLDATADEDSSGVFVVREGETETFTLTVVIDPAVAENYRVALEQIFFSNNSNGVTGVTAYELQPANTFKTRYRFISN